MFSRRNKTLLLVVTLSVLVHLGVLAELGYVPALPPASVSSSLARVARPVVASVRQAAAVMRGAEGVRAGYPPAAGDEGDPEAAPYLVAGEGGGGAESYYYDGMVPLDGEGPYVADPSFEFSASLFPFMRDFNPDSAHFKAGNVYFQALWVETGFLYSDYNGPAVFSPGEEDGFLGYAGFAFRVAAELTPSLTLAADGELIYLFGTNELGFRSGLGGGPFARLQYNYEHGSWDLMAYAEAGAGSLNRLFGSDAYDRAGRYSFGFLDYGDQGGFAYDPFLYTGLGAAATTLMNPEWRLTLTADHTDYWYLGDGAGDDHSFRDHLGVRYGAEPDTVPFAPWFSYDTWSDDQFDTSYSTVYAGGSGRLSEEVRLDARVGYLWSTGSPVERENWLWNIGLDHQINSRTSHGLRFGQDYFSNDFSIDSTVSSFVQYHVSHELSERIQLRAFAQWSSDEYLSGSLTGGEYEREMLGARASFQISDRVTSDLGYIIEYRENTLNGEKSERSLFDANLNWSFGNYSTVQFRYQHEDSDLFYEDLYMAGVRRHF